MLFAPGCRHRRNHLAGSAIWDVEDRRRSVKVVNVEKDLFRLIAPGCRRNYFAVLGIRIIQGHPESDVDSPEVVLNQSAARALWPHGNAVGRTLQRAISRTEVEKYRVAGIAKHVPVRSISEIEPVMYRMPYWTTARRSSCGARKAAPGSACSRSRRLEPNVTVTERLLADYVRARVDELRGRSRCLLLVVERRETRGVRVCGHPGRRDVPHDRERPRHLRGAWSVARHPADDPHEDVLGEIHRHVRQLTARRMYRYTARC